MRCAVSWCRQNNNSKSKKTENYSKDVKFFRFPKDAEMRKKWIRACKIPDKRDLKYARICSKHFSSEDYTMRSRLLNTESKGRQLKPEAVPNTSIDSENVPSKRSMRANRRSNKKIVESLLKEQFKAENPSLFEPVVSTVEVDKLGSNSNANSEVLLNSNENEKVVQNSKTVCKVRKNRRTDNQSNSNVKLVKVLRVPCTKPGCNNTMNAVITQKVSEPRNVSEKDNQIDYRAIHKMKRELDKLRKDYQKEKHYSDQLNKSLQQIFSPGQIKALYNPNKRVRWPTSDIANSLVLYSTGPKAYKLLLKKKYPLPATQTLRTWCARIRLAQGILFPILEKMKQSKLTELEKICTLSFDEMTLKSLYTQEIPDDTEKPSSFAQLVVAQGLIGDWKYPIFYKYDCKMTKEIMFDIIFQLERVGYKVKGIVTDMKASNQSLQQELQISIEKTYFRNPENPSEKIYVFPDALQLFIIIRNNFLDHGLMLNGDEINKEPLIKLLEDTFHNYAQTFTLTTIHLNPKKLQRHRIDLATQLFSDAISQAICSRGAAGHLTSSTWDECSVFIKQVNDWFHVLNIHMRISDASNEKTGFGLELEKQTRILDEMSKTMFGLRVKGTKSMLPFQKGVLITNSSLQLLFKEMNEKYGVNEIFTSRINKSIIENFLTLMRAGGDRGDHPTSLGFEYRLKAYWLGQNEELITADDNIIVDEIPEDTFTSVYKMKDNLIYTA